MSRRPQTSLVEGQTSLRHGQTSISSRRQGGGGGSTFGLVANRTQIATAVEAFSVTRTHRREHYAHPAGDIEGAVFSDVGWRYATTNSTAATSHSRKKYIEYPEGVFTQVTMGGSTAAQAISGGVIQKWDPVPFDIPAGAKFWERTVHTAGNIGLLELPAFPSVIGVDDGVADGDLGASGTIPAATARVGIAGSQWIEGTIKVGNAKSYVIIGDSIAWSQGDNESVGAKHGSGYQARALDNVASWMKAAIPGQQAADLVALLANADTRVSTLMQAIPASDAWFEHGVNDLRLGRTQAQLLADYATIAASQKSGRRISQSTLTPRTTGDWSTVAGQTVQTDGNWAALNSVNAAIRAPQSYVNGKIHEVADLAMSARDSEKWQAPPVPVADGTHPNSYMAALIAAGLTFN